MISESILNGFLKIFAIIAKPQSDHVKRRDNIRKFLDNQLNQIGVNHWLDAFDSHYTEAQKEKERREKKRLERQAVRNIVKKAEDKIKPTPNANYEKLQVVQIIEEISPDLPMEMKMIIIIQLLEFCKSEDPEIGDFLMDIIRGVAELINIRLDEFIQIKYFVLNDFETPPDSSDILILDNKNISDLKTGIHIYDTSVDGQIWFLYNNSVSSCFARYCGNSELTILGQIMQSDRIFNLPRGSSIKNKNKSIIYFSDISFYFKSKAFSSSGILYEAKEIEYRFQSGQVGLNKMSFSEVSGKMVGIMGASGTGKSTLLSILNGTNPPLKGEVLINGVNLHKEKEKLKGLIGFVSQDDLLIEDLTVFENLYFNAKLCFDNLKEEEIIKRVNDTLKSLDLFGETNKKVGSPVSPLISGGQRKRLNIALELIREPAIIFLDEPTSGLSSGDSENILGLLDDMTKKGKLVFVVLHQPSSDIFKMFDRLIILDVDKRHVDDDHKPEKKPSDGGYMIFNGNPLDSIEHFKQVSKSVNYTESECHACHNVNPEQIFSLVEAKILDKDGKTTKKRRITAQQWHTEFLGREISGHSDLFKDRKVPETPFKIPGRIKQIFIFAVRDFQTKIADTQYGIITLLVVPVLALVLSFLIRFFNETKGATEYSFMDNSNLPVYIFMSVIVAVFMGMILSAEEIIKNRKILKREAFLNLSWNSFLLSKVFVQFFISGIQAFLFVIIGNSIIGIKGMLFEYWAVLFSCWAFSNLMGLLISDSFRAVVTIYILIPVLVIPQILLSGIMVKYEKLNPDISSPEKIPVYGEFITARWGYEALAVYQFKNNRYEKQFYPYDKELSKSKFIKDYWCASLSDKLDKIIRDLNEGVKGPDFESNLSFARNELSSKITLIPEIEFDMIDSLTPSKVNSQIALSAKECVEKIRVIYMDYYNNVSLRRGKLLSKLETPDKMKLLKIKNDYSNTALKEFVTNNSLKEPRTIEYNNKLIQKFDPVYMDPEYPFIKAHFYSPSKRLFGYEIDTLIVNTMVIWTMTLAVYFALYFRLLKKIVDFSEKAISKISKRPVNP